MRDFEISLYWNRTTYFWGFQVALMAMAGLLLGPALGSSLSDLLAENLTAENERLTLGLILTSICFLGLFVSAVWSLMLDGAKYWQDNWERHIDILEDSVHGPMYKTYFKKSGDKFKPISVTKANSMIAKGFRLFWATIALLPLWTIWSSLSFLRERNEPTIWLGFFIYIFALAAAHSGLRASMQMTFFAKQVTDEKSVTHQLWTREALQGYENSCQESCHKGDQ